MALAHSKVTAQGQISVPAEIRKKLGIGPGSILEWEEDGEKIVVRRSGRFTSEDIHRALFPNKAPAGKTLEEMKEGFASARESVMRAVDTNVLVRLIARDDPGQVARAEKFDRTRGLGLDTGLS